MSSDNRYLEKHGNQWRVQVKVPVNVRSIVGKARLVRGLGTESLSKAKLLRFKIVGEFHQVIADAKRQLDGQQGSAATSLAREAGEYFLALKEAERNPLEDADYDERGEIIADGPMLVRSLIGERTLELSRERNPQDASTFNALALGVAVPITQFVEDWLNESTMKVRQKIDYRRAIRKLDRWLAAQSRPITIASVIPRVAGEYVSKSLLTQTRSRRTVNKDIACLSSYWRWLIKKDHTEINPWVGQSVSEPSKPQSEEPRAFTKQELQTLFGGNTSVLMRDFMLVAALTGLRIGEIAALQVRDVHGSSFNIRRSKSRAGERLVPTHAALVSLVERRSEGKAPLDLLFSDLPPHDPSKAQEQASPVTKAFVNYRRKLGVDEMLEGSSRSLVNFHSFRKWFIREASSALDQGATGYNLYTLADVVGHSKKDMPLGMTMGVYAGPSNEKAKRACVNAVVLPKDCLS